MERPQSFWTSVVFATALTLLLSIWCIPIARADIYTEVLRHFAKRPASVVAMEACGSAHYWARELAKLGHEVRLIAAQFVRPFVLLDVHPVPRSLGVGRQSLSTADHEGNNNRELVEPES